MNLRDVKLKKLLAFQMIGRHQSIQEAAAQMRLSVPAVSIQLSSLEKDLGVKLLRRAGRKMALTPAGEQFLPQVEAIFEKVEAALKSVSGAPDASGVLSLVVSSDLAMRFSDVIGDFIKQRPVLKVHVQLRSSSEMISLLGAGKAELGLGYFDEIPQDLLKRSLGESRFSLAFSPTLALARKGMPTLHQIAKHRLIIIRNNTNLGRRVWRVFNDAGVEPAGVVEAGNCPLSLELAKKGAGVAVVHTPCMSDADRKALRVVDFSKYMGKMQLAVLWRRAFRLSSTHMDLIDRLAHSAEIDLAAQRQSAATMSRRQRQANY